MCGKDLSSLFFFFNITPAYLFFFIVYLHSIQRSVRYFQYIVIHFQIKREKQEHTTCTREHCLCLPPQIFLPFQMASKHIRLLKDLAQIEETFQTDHVFYIKKRIEASTCDAIHDTDLTHPIFIYTPQQAPYLGGEFEVEIHLPLDYPSTTPRVKFRTPIYSPVVDESGVITCLPILQRWQTIPANAVRLQHILLEIDYYITHLEDVDEPHRPVILTEWRKEPLLFSKTAERQTKELAKPQRR